MSRLRLPGGGPGLAAALLAVVLCAACNETGPYGSTQGGTGRAPGAPPTPAATAAPTATAPR
ncbi:MAG TPA: hypothetical protein VHS99_11045 [Chloroflexota bacterium]|jgi:hypothetical protein|nr:hypothetical protein [Chloroflexota bacterium]